MTLPVPFFLPTSSGDLSAIVDLPSESVECEVPIVLFPGAASTRLNSSIRKRLIMRLTARGHPVFRLENPGYGISGTEPMPLEKLMGVFEDACSWLIDMSQVAKLRLVGDCLGANVAIAVTARLPNVSDVVAIDCPIRVPPGRRWGSLKVRAGLASVDPIGKRFLPKLARGARSEEIANEEIPHLVSDIMAATSVAPITFVYSSQNLSRRDFQSLCDSGQLPNETMSRIRVVDIEGDRVYNPFNIQEVPTRVALLESLLSAPIVEDVSG